MAALANLAVSAGTPAPVFAQATRADAASDADDGRTDAILAMPNLSTPTPLSNLYATAPGLEGQIPAPRLGANLLLPLGWDANANEVGSGGTPSWQSSPFGNISMSAPIGAPFRFTATGFGELNRYFSAPDVDVDRTGGSARLQYVDPTDDQAFSPYAAYAPRWQWALPESGLIETRQDFNLGFNKRFNLDDSFQLIPIAPDTSSETVWSFGLTAFAQRRVRDTRLSSNAVFLIPSLSYAISKDWSASFAVEMLGRWFERNPVGEANRVWEALPVATLEYLIPASLLGGENVARLVGRPALDLQGSYNKVWSTASGASFNQWDTSATIKMGWRF